MSAPKPGLRARSSSVQAALTAAHGAGEPAAEPAPVPAPAAPPAATEKVKPVGLSVRLPYETHEALRKIAFDERVSIHSLLMEGVEMVLKNRGNRG